MANAASSIMRYPYIILGLFSLFQLWPWAVFDIGGDKVTYQFYMECFARSLFSGEIRPSWCYAANGGYGTPIFLFYFPLSYYLSSVFYPLKMLGISSEQIFILQIYLANLLFAATAYCWLRNHTTNGKALLVACLLLYVPYRLELLFFRAAHTELFAIALLPLWLIAAERIMKNHQRWHMLALIAGLTAITHTPMALIFGIITSLYALFLRRCMKVSSYIILAGLLGVLLAAYFLFPVVYYQQFILGASGGTDYSLAAFNRYPTLGDFSFVRSRLLLLTALSLLVVTIYTLRIWRKTKAPDFRAWTFTLLISLMLYSPLIAPLFDNIHLFRSIFFPWRMQVVFIPVCAILMLIFLQRKKNKQTLAADMVILLAFLNLLQVAAAQVTLPEQDAQQSRIVDRLISPNKEYANIWQPDNLSIQDVSAKRLPTIVDGNASIESELDSSGKLSMQVTAKEASTVLLHQAHFPSWIAKSQAGELPVRPDVATGSALVDVPKGRHSITMKHEPYGSAAPLYVRLSPWVSLMALLYLLTAWRKQIKVSRGA